MTLLYIEYLIPLILLLLVLSFYFTKLEDHYFTWVEDFWFFKRSRSSRLASGFFIIGIALLSLAALDLRGPEENIEAKVSKEKTLILVDSSSSMLAEDVRPNRFKKAIVLAKHYAKKAVGQYISIVAFSDSQKKIIPFTNDIDLIEARLSALENANLTRGGTSLKKAIQEAVQYYKVDDKDSKGNILIFTDAENTESFSGLNVPNNVNVAVVGVGTVKGGNIPLRDQRGIFRGNKKFMGKEVITKLDEKFLIELGRSIKNYNYWTASSYSLPTVEILNFFNTKMDAQDEKANVRIRPVLANFVMIPAVILLILSFLLRNFRSFVLPMLLIFSFSGFSQSTNEKKSSEKPKKKSKDALYLEGKLRDGSINEKELGKLANELLKTKHSKQAMSLYEEQLDSKTINDKNASTYFNYGASQVLEKKTKEGLGTYKKLYDYLKKNGKNPGLLEKTKENMLKALIVEQQEKKKEQDQKKENKKNDNKKDSKKGKEDKESDSKKNSSEGKSGSGSEENEKDKNGSSSKSDKQDNKESNKNKDKKDNSDKSDDNKDQSSEKKNEKSSNEKGKSIPKKKIPALLKQLMQDDNALQRKMIDTSSSESKTRDKKDW